MNNFVPSAAELFTSTETVSGARRAWIGLGANLGDPVAQVRGALEAIAAIEGVTMLARSSLYRTAPMGLPGQADYCNAVCAIETRLAPRALMAELLRIEREFGRFRDGRRWGSRMLDLDLLHVEGEQREDDALRLPHPGVGDRNFVMVPLAEIAPDLEIPGVGRVAARADALGRAGLALWDDLASR